MNWVFWLPRGAQLYKKKHNIAVAYRASGKVPIDWRGGGCRRLLATPPPPGYIAPSSPPPHIHPRRVEESPFPGNPVARGVSAVFMWPQWCHWSQHFKGKMLRYSRSAVKKHQSGKKWRPGSCSITIFIFTELQAAVTLTWLPEIPLDITKLVSLYIVSEDPKELLPTKENVANSVK